MVVLLVGVEDEDMVNLTLSAGVLSCVAASK
jgi:hypothetical protein